MRKLLLVVLWNMCLLSAAWGQKAMTIEGEYVYHAPENVTIEEAKRTAIERAKITALADAFGTIVSQVDISDISNREGRSAVDFMSFGESEVKGEWIETLESPEPKVDYAQGMLVVTAKVKGKAREISTYSIDLKALILRNGTTDKFASTSFRDNDDMYLLFSSPVKGYLAVYLVDEEQQASCLLPYQGQEEGSYAIRPNRDYLFFKESEAEDGVKAVVDEYRLTASRALEYNRIYVVFSPNEFVKARDNAAQTVRLLPRQLALSDFQRWLARCRKRDVKMTATMIPITIRR